MVTLCFFVTNVNMISTRSNSRYVDWLKSQGTPLYKGANIFWRIYHKALIPAPATPCYINLDRDEARSLLYKSGALFIRYTSVPSNEPTEWWYIMCDSYDQKKLSSSTRSKINRGMKHCSVKIVNTYWLAINGYECYKSAFDRYANTVPLSKESYQKSITETISGPFEYWGIFVEDHLAGYCQCIIENNEIATSMYKYDPKYLKYYTSYALLNTLLTYYVAEGRKCVSNSTRSIAHETNIQDFLLKFNFQRHYCHLNIVYRPLMNLAIQSLYPLRTLINQLPNKGTLHKVRSLLFQEQLRRSFD